MKTVPFDLAQKLASICFDDACFDDAANDAINYIIDNHILK